MAKIAPKAFGGPVLFSYGFRPFFLGAIVFASLVIPFWVGVFQGTFELGGFFSPIDWHIHEMLFGYTAAVVSGFLFTAIPNWTGRMPIKGWPLALLAALWVLGRLAMLGISGLSPPAVAVIDCAFLAAIGAMILREIIAGQNWRNLKVVVPILLFLAANLLFHFEVLTQGGADYSRRMGLAVVIFLITLIGGRIIPSFTRNWLVKSNPGALPIPFNRFDAVCLLAGAITLVVWVVLPDAPVTGTLLYVAAALHLFRLTRWKGHRTLASLLLLMLHIAYAFIPLGFLVLGLGHTVAALHLLGIGAVGGMTTAVMIRATLGHTGRSLESGKALGAGFILIFLAGIMRSAASDAYLLGLSGLVVSATLWTVGFGLLFIWLGPCLWSPKAGRKTPNQHA